MTFDLLDTSSVLEQSDCGNYRPIELFDQEHIHQGLVANKEVAAPVSSKAISDMMLDAPKWLPFAAEQYQISANIRDYVMVPVIIMPTDLPNRNKVAFPYTELSSFLPNTGQISFQTWRGKPTFIEHINRDWTKAKGVVMDVSMIPMHGRAGNLWKVLALCGFDRNKDAMLANDILTGARQNYSMGALVSVYSCSICGSASRPGEGKKLPCGHEHVSPKGPMQVFKSNQGDILGHYNAHTISGFEVSSVTVPAWPSASSGTDLHLTY